MVSGAEARIVDDLRWLGLDWDGDVVRQSERHARYDAALAALDRAGKLYPCDCSRAEIARVASAPHAGEDLRYPGTCREKPRERAFKKAPSWRFRVPDDLEIAFVDGFLGPQRERVGETVGDFALKRGDGVYAYQLAVVVDDLAMGVDHVVRGADLLGSTARQIALARALEGRPPDYLHAPLVLGPDGARLAKRAQGIKIAGHRAAGVSPDALVGALAGLIGLTDGAAASPRVLLASYDRGRVSRSAVRVPAAVEGFEWPA